MTAKPRAAKRKPDLAERIYRRLFVLRDWKDQPMALSLQIYPPSRPTILAAIREEIARD